MRLNAMGAVLLAMALPVCARGQAANPGLRPAAVQPESHTGTRNAGGRPVHNEAERAARWKSVKMPYNKAGLTAREQQMVAKLADACRLLDEVFWHQSDLGGWAMAHTTPNAVMGKLFAINGSRWDLVDDNFPFSGEEPMPPGHELYPYGLTRAEAEKYVAAHPDEKAAIYDPHTVVRSAPLDRPARLSQPVVYGVPEKLYTYPYHVAFAEWLKPMAEDLRAAAKMSPDLAFAKFLNLRANALLSDDYYASDVAWLDLKDPKVDLIFAPYEVYLDGLLGVKTSYGASILIRNDAESRKLAMYQQHEAVMQQALPIDAADKPSKEGQATPMEVADAPLRAGDLLHGYQAVADNLPNDPRIHAEKGSKKIFFKNFMDARVENVVLPIAGKMMTAEQAKDVSGEGYLTATILHEISHGLGPAWAHVDGKQIAINVGDWAGVQRPRRGEGGCDGNLSGEVADRPEAAAGERDQQSVWIVCCGDIPHAALRHGRGTWARADDGVQLSAGEGRACTRLGRPLHRGLRGDASGDHGAMQDAADL